MTGASRQQAETRLADLSAAAQQRQADLNAAAQQRQAALQAAALTDDMIKEIIQRSSESLIKIQTKDNSGFGTKFVITNKGDILTNYHVSW